MLSFGNDEGSSGASSTIHTGSLDGGVPHELKTAQNGCQEGSVLPSERCTFGPIQSTVQVAVINLHPGRGELVWSGS